jgi:hypothetical protein
MTETNAALLAGLPDDVQALLARPPLDDTMYTGAPDPRGQERVVVVIEPERQTVGVG